MAATEWQRNVVIAKLKELDEIKPGKQEATYERILNMALGGDGGKINPSHEDSVRKLHYSNWEDIDFDLVLEELNWGDKDQLKKRSKRIKKHSLKLSKKLKKSKNK
jgi:hypothetical protein